ncbi:hypothetical protein ACRN9F_02280 [Shewanella oncorhynchi]|uniref:hypothetical protein n=1 Tax=Shewanella oncorhynchi TaxID=2726434 RepID=UPI003D7BDD3E
MKPRSENQKDKAKLELTIKICEHLLRGQAIELADGEINCWPSQFPIMSKTEAKKRGLELKRNQLPVCFYSFTLPRANGRGYGSYYLESSFKLKQLNKARAAA